MSLTLTPGIVRFHPINLVIITTLLACETDVTDSPPSAFLEVHAVLADGVTAGNIDLGRITLQGPTPRTIDTSPGSTETITGLQPGTYTVILEGITGGEVELYGELPGVIVNAGSNTQVSISLGSFVPNLAALPPIVDAGQDLVVSYSRVPAATGYTVEWDDNPIFDTPRLAQSADTAVSIRPDPGKVYVRVRAHDRLGSAGKASSSAVVDVPIPAVPTDQAFLVTGSFHTCALVFSRQAYCWGDDRSGQLGDDLVGTSTEPVPVAGANSFVTLSAGNNASYTCGLDPAGAAFCWGSNVYGQLGDGTQDDRGIPAPVSGGLTFVSIGAGINHTCAVTDQGRAWCWGRNALGALGDGSNADRAEPGPVQSSLEFTSIASGFDFSCAVTISGQVYCWGNNSDGQTGDGQSTSAKLAPVAVNGLPPVVGVTAGSFHACAWTASGTGYCWGRGSFGRLGNGDMSQGPKPPAQVVGRTDFVRISAGNGFACGVTADHRAWCWGFGNDGRLGTGDEDSRSIPTQVIGVSTAITISAGGAHACAILLSGEAYCWGYWSLGALGIGKSAGQPEPVMLSGGPPAFGSVTTGGSFACATASGSAYCWGGNQNGQLGTGDTSNRSTPVAVAGGLTFSGVSAGGSHACGVTAAAEIWCWGSGSSGRLGTGSSSDSPVPVRVAGGQSMSAVTAGYSHTCAISQYQPGTITCWGSNPFGQVGNGTTTDQLSPAIVYGLPAMAQVSAGELHTCALAVDGRVFCWGRNAHGVLGDGTTIDRKTPVQVQGLPPAIAVSAGAAHACALTSGGSAYCWGYGVNGQLGDDQYTSSTSPVLVAGGIPFSTISAGTEQTCAIANDGRGYCWGLNQYGQLGIGTFDTQGIPFEVAGNLRFPISAGSSGGALQAGRAYNACGVATDQRVYCWGRRDSGALGDGIFPIELAPVPVSGGIIFRTQ